MVTYFYIDELNKLAKEEDYVPYLFNDSNGLWEVDNDNLIMDLMKEIDPRLNEISQKEAERIQDVSKSN